MSILSMLNLSNAVQIRRITVGNDGMGAQTTSTSLTTISRAAIWQASGNDVTISDKITSISTHVLAMRPSEYTFTDDDQEVIYNGVTYTITGHADDIMQKTRLLIVGLQRTS